MIYGGNATVYVSDMDKAVQFYSEVLGLKLTNRFGNHWATVRAGRSLVIGLHPLRTGSPAPGTRGSVQIGLVLEPDQPIEQFADRLRRHGVDVGEIIASEAGNYLTFEDPDGNSIYIGDWDPDFDALPDESREERLARQREETAGASVKDLTAAVTARSVVVPPAQRSSRTCRTTPATAPTSRENSRARVARAIRRDRCRGPRFSRGRSTPASSARTE